MGCGASAAKQAAETPHEDPQSKQSSRGETAHSDPQVLSSPQSHAEAASPLKGGKGFVGESAPEAPSLAPEDAPLLTPVLPPKPTVFLHSTYCSAGSFAVHVLCSHFKIPLLQQHVHTWAAFESSQKATTYPGAADAARSVREVAEAHRSVSQTRENPDANGLPSPLSPMSLPLLRTAEHRFIAGAGPILCLLSEDWRSVIADDAKGASALSKQLSALYPTELRPRALVDQSLSWLQAKLISTTETHYVALVNSYRESSHWVVQSELMIKASELIQMELEVLELQFRDHGKPYVAGSTQLSVADILGVCALQVLQRHSGSSELHINVAEDKYPHVVQWASRVRKELALDDQWTAFVNSMDSKARATPEAVGQANVFRLYGVSLTAEMCAIQSVCAYWRVPVLINVPPDDSTQSILDDEIGLELQHLKALAGVGGVDGDQGVLDSVMMELPLLADQHKVVRGGTTILKYLAIMVRSPLFAGDFRVRAEVDQMLCWVHSKFAPVLWDLRHPAERSAEMGEVTQRSVRVLQNLLRLVDDSFLQASNFLCGDTLTLADVYLCSAVMLIESNSDLSSTLLADAEKSLPRLWAWKQTIRDTVIGGHLAAAATGHPRQT